MTRLGVLVLVCIALHSGCGTRPVATRPAEPELVALLPEAEGGAPGRASVSNQFGAVDLGVERTATRVVAGGPPTPVVTLSDADVTAIFGEALSALPLTPRYFVLHFRFESNELTDESRALLPQVLQAVAAYSAPEVVAVGHTDSSGDSQANYELGLNRARAIRALLVDVGVNPSLIEVTSHGEGNLLIPTADGTLEPRNRRVEITVR